MKQISNLDEKVNIEKRKVTQDDLTKLNELIANLRNISPGIERAIDTNYYSCYGEINDVNVNQTGNTAVYIVSGDHFRDYLTNLYGVTPVLPSIRTDISFNRVDIFSKEWAERYGYPFSEAAFGSSDFSFSGSFSCLNSGPAVKGSAVITGIGSNFIEARNDQGEILRFNLGSCSRL